MTGDFSIESGAVGAERLVAVVPGGRHAAEEHDEARAADQEQHGALALPVDLHAATAARSSSGRRNCPVYDPGTEATSSGLGSSGGVCSAQITTGVIR